MSTPPTKADEAHTVQGHGRTMSAGAQGPQLRISGRRVEVLDGGRSVCHFDIPDRPRSDAPQKIVTFLVDEMRRKGVEPPDEIDQRLWIANVVAVVAGEPYRIDRSGVTWLRATRDGTVPTSLINVPVLIAAEIIRDDGSGEEARDYEMLAIVRGRVREVRVRAARFGGMAWPTEALGAEAILAPGQAIRDRARAAIQVLSRPVPERYVYAHLGWRRLGDGWAYLHSGGAIGGEGFLPGVEVEMPAPLAHFVLPEPPEGEALRQAVHASLRFLDVGPDAVTVPVFCAIWRSVLGNTDFSLHLAGRTGAGKSELAALAQQHFGKAMDARHLPGAWSGTANAVETLAFLAKDAFLTVDDFAPQSAVDGMRLQREADRLLRAQGNAAGRVRLHSDASLRAARPPRGLILSTGEDVPQGQSLRARLLTLEMPAGAMRWQGVTACQKDAATELYAQALSGFVRWLAPQYDDVRRGLGSEMEALREQATREGQHRRTPGIVASLAVGLNHFLRYAEEIGALDAQGAKALFRRAWNSLGEAAAAQDEYQEQAEPTGQFLAALRAILTSGQAHVATTHGGCPALTPGAWGWRVTDEGGAMRPQGRRIGWVDKEDLLLQPEAAYAEVQKHLRDAGGGLPVSLPTLQRRLAETGLLATETRGGKRRLRMRRVIEGGRRDVLAIPTEALYQEQVSQVSQNAAGARWEPVPAGTLDKNECPTSVPAAEEVAHSFERDGTLSEELGHQWDTENTSVSQPQHSPGAGFTPNGPLGPLSAGRGGL